MVASIGFVRYDKPIAALSLIFIAISYSPWFSWTGNALSDLGASSAAAIFNSGLILAGLLSIIFAAGFIKSMRKKHFGFAGTFIFILGDISLMAMGVFPESAERIHLYVSVAFFALEPIAFFIIGATLIQKPSDKSSGLFSILTAAWAVGVWAFWFWATPHNGVAIPELLSSLAFSSWSIVFGARLLRQTSAL